MKMTNIKNGGMPAMPVTWWTSGGQQVQKQYVGLTKREQFAMAAMQGLLANPAAVIQGNIMSGFGWCNTDSAGMADLAIECADAMLRRLEEAKND